MQPQMQAKKERVGRRDAKEVRQSERTAREQGRRHSEALKRREDVQCKEGMGNRTLERHSLHVSAGVGEAGEGAGTRGKEA